MNANELSSLLASLSSHDKKTLFDLLQTEVHDSAISEISEKAICCPICDTVDYVIRNGKRNGLQRFLCKKCKKSFMGNTNTILERTHKPLETWKKFIECMALGMPLIKTAEICQINKNTAFVWRHKILDALSCADKDTSLSGIVEADETFFVLSYKGQKKNLPRKAKKRATPAKKRGLSNEQVSVPCGLDREGNTISKIGNLGKFNIKGLSHVFNGKIKKMSVLCTDKASAYRKFSESQDLQLVQLKGGKEKLGIYHINHINAYHSGLKTFLRRFNGVSTKYLDNYLTWNIWNSKKATIKEKTQSMLHDISQANIVVRFNEIWNRPNFPDI